MIDFKVSKFVNGIYGTTFKQNNGEFENIDFLLTDKKKIDIIKKIQNDENTSNIIYFGDGLTDKLAFEYVHSIGGKNVFIVSNEKSIDTFEKLNVDGVIDECFNADFGIESQISKYIQFRNLDK